MGGHGKIRWREREVNDEKVQREGEVKAKRGKGCLILLQHPNYHFARSD